MTAPLAFYDREADALRVYLVGAMSVPGYSVEVGAGVVLDYDPAGALVAVTVLDATKRPQLRIGTEQEAES